MGAFVVISRFKVSNGTSPQVRDAFMSRPHLVDGATGFLGMEVLSPTTDPDEFWLLTRWADKESYFTWYRGHAYRESHQGVPPGLQLDPARTLVMTFTSFAS